jgi:pre-mRNA-splicing factor 38A
MANRTDKEAGQVHGTNPQNLVEYIVRQKIYDSPYWKEHCFGLSAERIVDKAVQLRYACGMYGEPQKPSEFICLILKMLQIQPSKDIVVEFIKNDDFKYLRLLGAFYLRLTGRAGDIYQYLEPFLSDYRKVRVRLPDGSFSLSHVDDLIEKMLGGDYMFNISLPRLPTRLAMEKTGALEPWVSVLQDEFDEAALQEEKEEAERAAGAAREAAAAVGLEDGERRPRDRSPWRLRKEERRRRARSSRSRSRDRDRDQGGGRDRRWRDERRDRSRSRDGRSRDYSREWERNRERRNSRRSRSRSRGRQEDRREDKGGDRERERRAPAAEEGDEIAEANALRARLKLKPLK